MLKSLCIVCKFICIITTVETVFNLFVRRTFSLGGFHGRRKFIADEYKETEVCIAG